MKDLFQAFISNADDKVSTGGVLAIIAVLTWLVMYVWCQLHCQGLRVSPGEITALAGVLYGIPKVRK